jgi:molybdenum cofactor sulfurtransferase
LSHNNGHPLVVLYGAWANDEIESDRGPTVAFNCVRADGSVVGYNEVAKLAELTQPPLQLRTGCFCNPGACQEALELSDEDVQENYYSRGHVCGDQIDVIDGRPTGAVRVSLGKDNIWEDVDRLICFLEKTFVSRSVALKEISEGPTSTKARITELYLFPIKSCAAQRVKVWPLDTTSGRVLWDREFALVDSFGTAMRLQRYPKMAQIRPTIDLEESTMTVTAPGCKDLVLSLRDEGGVKPNGSIQVCGSKCGGQLWGNWETSNWFSNFLGVECWLARYKDSREGQASVPQVAFANEKPILLISENEVNRLNILLEKQGLEKVKTRHFRPNVVVTTNIGVSEYSWSTLSLGNRVQYSTSGECARCSMVDIDPETSSKGNTLCSLAQYRRTNGSITFGVFLRLAGTSIKEDAALSEGDILYCE